MICPRCSVAEMSPETNRCVLCGYSAGQATAVALDVRAPAPEPRGDPVARDELAQLFHIERALDPGGFVTTCVAREADTERKIVLRVLPRQPVRDAGLEDRLLRELATAASLDHPHIVPLYRYGATPRYLWYSGKHVPGQSLAELLRASGPLELHATLRLVEQVASALQYAHRRGIVHADVRPGNVRVDPNGWSLLTGFAVGRALDRLPLAALGGRSLRRPEYLAPEERTSRQPGPASDQYSLAVLVYECLTGVLPFDGMGADDDASPPALTEPHPDIPEHVQEGLRRALNPQPGARFHSILEFVSVLESEPVLHARPQASRPSERQPAPPAPPAPPPPPLPPRRARPTPKRPGPVSEAGSAAHTGPTTKTVDTADTNRNARTARTARTTPTAHTAPARPSNNTPVLLDEQPGRWRAALKWVVFLALLAAGGVYGPNIFQGLRGGRPARGTPALGGPPQLVARDSGLSARPSPPPDEPDVATDTAPAPVVARPIPPAPSVIVPPRATAPPPRATAPRPTPPQPVARVTASPYAPSRLFVNSTPWGQVYVDGQLVGNTPQANLVISAGTHRLRVMREGFQTFERVVQLAPGQELRLTDIVLQESAP